MELTVCIWALRWYRHHPQHFEELEKLAKSSNIHVERFQSECPTRWDTSFDSWSGHARNTQAMRVYHAVQPASPEPLSNEEFELLEDILTVLKPTKVATLLMQQSATASLASQYLPLLEGLLRQLGPCTTMFVPKVNPTINEKPKSVGSMKPLALKLRRWLHDDYEKMKQKHLIEFNPESLLTLQISSFLDPRHKDLAFLEASVAETVRKKAEAFVLHRSDCIAKLRDASATIASANPGDRCVPVAESAGNSAVTPAAVASTSSSSSQIVTDDLYLRELAPENLKKRRREQAKRSAKEEKEKAKQHLLVAKAAQAAEQASVARLKRRSAYTVAVEDDHSLSRELFFPSLAEDRQEQLKKVSDQGASLLKLIKKEITFYRQIPEERNWALDPVAWWQGRQSQMPYLSRAAFTMLGIPGSSHALEQAFSRASRGVDYKRKPRLSGQIAASLIFAHENYRRGHII